MSDCNAADPGYYVSPDGQRHRTNALSPRLVQPRNRVGLLGLRRPHLPACGWKALLPPRLTWALRVRERQELSILSHSRILVPRQCGGADRVPLGHIYGREWVGRVRQL